MISFFLMMVTSCWIIVNQPEGPSCDPKREVCCLGGDSGSEGQASRKTKGEGGSSGVTRLVHRGSPSCMT